MITRGVSSAAPAGSAFGERPTCALQWSRTAGAGRHLCKVAFAPHQSLQQQPEEAVDTVAESLAAKYRDCVQQYHGGARRAEGRTTATNSSLSPAASLQHRDGSRGSHAGGSAAASGASSSSSNSGWLWGRWPQAKVATNSSSSGSRHEPAHWRLEQSAAAVAQKHAKRSSWRQSAPASSSASYAAGASSSNSSSTYSVLNVSATAVAVQHASAVPADTFGAAAAGPGGHSSSSSSSLDEACALLAFDESWGVGDVGSSCSGSGGATSTELFLHDLMPPAAAAAVAGQAAAGDGGGGGGGSSKLALLLGDTYPTLLRSSSRSGAAAPARGMLAPQAHGAVTEPAAAPPGTLRQQQRQQRGGQLQQHQQQQLPLHVGGRSSSLDESGGDWLTAVLSDPTTRLTANSNAVLTNSLRRLASLRSGPAGAGGAAVGAAAAAAAAAVEGPEGLLDSIRARFGTFQLQEFEEVAMQLAKLGMQPHTDWLAEFDRCSMRVMPGGSPRLLSKLLLARARLGGRVGAEWCSLCLEHMTAQPDKLSVSSWVNALWGLVRLRHPPNRQFHSAFFSCSAGRLDDVSPALLTHLVWSLSRLRLAPGHLWWRRLVAATAALGDAFSHAQLASLLHSLALWAEPGGIAPRDVQRLADALLLQVQAQLGLLQPAELTSLLWSLGGLVARRKLTLGADLQESLLSAVQGQLPRLSPAQLSDLCWGLAWLDPALPPGFGEALLLEVQAQLAGFSDAGLCNVLWALARLGLWTGTAFREALWGELQQRCAGLCLQDLSTLTWALAQLQLQPPEDLLQDLGAASLRHLPLCDAAQLTNIVWALGRLGARPGQAWVAAAEAASLQVLPTAGLHQLVNLAWGLCQLRQGEEPPTPAPEAWQAACLRELRLRCMCAGHDADCGTLVTLLHELGVAGLFGEAAAAAADALFEGQDEEGCCSVQFQPGCR